jgi:hypothetical protein
MRTDTQKKAITDRYETATVHKGIVNQGFIDYLLNQFHNSEHIEKNTGPVVMNYSPDREGLQEWFEPVQKFVDNLIGESLVWGSNIFRVEKPHIIHNDDYHEKIYDIYKTIVIPLEISKPTNFVVFDQYYLDGPVKCFKGYENVPETYYNKILTDYSDIVGYTDEPFNKQIYNEYLTHVPYEALHGLTVESIVRWQPGDAITFDMGKLHSAVDFISQGIDYKIGYSIFTAKY